MWTCERCEREFLSSTPYSVITLGLDALTVCPECAEDLLTFPETDYYVHEEPWNDYGESVVVLSKEEILDLPSKWDDKFKCTQDKLDHFVVTHFSTKLTQAQYNEYKKLQRDFFNKVREENGHDPHSTK